MQLSRLFPCAVCVIAVRRFRHRFSYCFYFFNSRVSCRTVEHILNNDKPLQIENNDKPLQIE
jgi:hypothetical protein